VNARGERFVDEGADFRNYTYAKYGQEVLKQPGQVAWQIYDGKVARLMDFGAFVTILPGKDGLVHISQISDERVERVSDKLKEGDAVRVKVLEVDRQGRIRLSMRDVNAA
jgi:polyribonucleotide nucleotidyltransferase